MEDDEVDEVLDDYDKEKIDKYDAITFRYIYFIT